MSLQCFAIALGPSAVTGKEGMGWDVLEFVCVCVCVWFLVTTGILNLVTEVPSLLPNAPGLQYN